ncbi:Transposase [Mesobacillus zeae]
MKIRVGSWSILSKQEKLFILEAISYRSQKTIIHGA